jgi:cell division protein FtsQ
MDGGERRMSRVKSSPRNSVNDRPPGWRMVLRRQRRLLRPAGWIALALVVGVLGVIVIRSAGPHVAPNGTLTSMRERLGAVAAASGLRVTDIVIEGRLNTPEPLLWSAIGVKKGDPILGFSLEETRANIERIPWVEHATVERRLPGTLVINLQERRPFAIWQNQGKFVLVDRAGQVVGDQDVSQFRHLPLIVGQGAPGAAAGLLDALRDRPALAEKVMASVRVGERRWNLRMNSGTDVMLPEGHEVVALDRLIQLQQDRAVLDRPLAAIDMRLPDRMVFRPKIESKDGTVIPPVPPGSNPPTVPVVAKKPN